MSAVAAPIASKLSDSAFGATDAAGNRIGGLAGSTTSSQIFAQTGAAFISSVVTELTRVAIQDGKVSWVSVASSTADAFTRAAIGQMVAEQRSKVGNTVPVAKSAATEPAAYFADLPAEVRPLMLNGSSAGGLSASNTASPYPLPPEMGGLSVYFPFTSDQYMPDNNAATIRDYFSQANAQQKAVAATRSNAAENKIRTSNGFTEYRNNEFTRSRLQLTDGLLIKATNSASQNKAMANPQKVRYDNYVLRDGDKHPTVSIAEYNSQQALLNSWDYQQASNLSQSLPLAGTAVTGIAGVGYLSGLNLSARTIVTANAVIGGGAKAYTNIVDKGELRPVSILFAAATSAVGGQVGGSYSYFGNGVISSGFSVLDTGFNNFIYKGNNDSYADAALLSFAGGGLGKYSDSRITTSLQLKSLPITYSNVSNFAFKAPVTGGVTGSVISNIPPVLLREKKPE